MNDYPSVTQVLSVYQDFSNIPPATLDYATERGIAIHKACAAHALGLWVPKLPSEWQGYVDSFIGWYKAIVVRVVLVEKRLICTCYQYTGRPDLVVQIVGDKGLIVVDLKSPQVEAPTWKSQNAAYKHLVECCEAPVARCGSLKLHPKGGMAKLVEHTQNTAADFNAFLAALTAWRYFK